MRRLILSVAAVVGLSACGPLHRLSSDLISPTEAIISAATAAPRPVPGRFTIRVTSTGRQDGNIYLNSEADYRDQRNLTVAIRAPAIGELAARYGMEADAYLVGKRVVVQGLARRVRIDFTHNGQPTDKYYYQTHVDVFDADQLTILGTGD